MANVVTKQTTITAGTNGNGKATNSQSVGYIVYFIFGLIEILLIFRLLFKLSGANPDSGFVSFIYSLTQIFILPFSGIFHQATTTGVETTAVLEPAVIIAMVVYAALAWGIAQLVVILSGRMQN